MLLYSYNTFIQEPKEREIGSIVQMISLTYSIRVKRELLDYLGIRLIKNPDSVILLIIVPTLHGNKMKGYSTSAILPMLLHPDGDRAP